MQKQDWPWFYSTAEEAPWTGPFMSREEAITEGQIFWSGCGIFVCQCESRAEKLSDWIEAENTLERADEIITDSDRVNFEFDETVFEATVAQQEDLTARLKRACDEWQAAHGLKFVPNTFAFMGPLEWIAPAEAEAEAEAESGES